MPPRAERDRVAGLVLAAGGSSRLGRPKQLLPYRGATLLDAVLATARACPFDQLVVALGGAADAVRATVDLSGAEVVVNEGFGSGCSSSIAAAMEAVDDDVDVVVLLLGDQPGVSPASVRALLEGRGGAPLAVCAYDDGRGHPFAFGPLGLRRSAGAARRQGGVEAPRPPGGRRRRRPGGGPGAAGRRHLGGLRGGAGGRGVVSGRARAGASAAVAELLPDAEALATRLDGVDYLADEGLATAMFLALRLPQPLLLEGEAGVGKTEAARALAEALGTPLIRLQCYEGMDSSEALYEWNYPRQLLRIRLAEAEGERAQPLGEEDLFGDAYLLRRPVLQAIEHPGPLPAVLLIDELDRADHDFEAFLLELLADAAVTVPEIGTIRAAHPPVVVVTSNRTRDLHDALKRRCLYHWIDYPAPEREVEIVRRRVPGAPDALARSVTAALGRLRAADVQKPPGIAEGIDWVAALEVLGAERLDEESADRTLGAVLKYRDDQEAVRAAGLAKVVGA